MPPSQAQQSASSALKVIRLYSLRIINRLNVKVQRHKQWLTIPQKVLQATQLQTCAWSVLAAQLGAQADAHHSAAPWGDLSGQHVECTGEALHRLLVSRGAQEMHMSCTTCFFGVVAHHAQSGSALNTCPDLSIFPKLPMSPTDVHESAEAVQELEIAGISATLFSR